jgi:hypothetical protein
MYSNDIFRVLSQIAVHEIINFTLLKKIVVFWISRYIDSLRDRQSGNRIPEEARFFAPVQTGLRASYTRVQGHSLG